MWSVLNVVKEELTAVAETLHTTLLEREQSVWGLLGEDEKGWVPIQTKRDELLKEFNSSCWGEDIDIQMHTEEMCRALELSQRIVSLHTDLSNLVEPRFQHRTEGAPSVGESSRNGSERNDALLKAWMGAREAQARVLQRPLVATAAFVSSETFEGVPALERSIRRVAARESASVFPQLHSPVPMPYAVLDLLCRQGSSCRHEKKQDEDDVASSRAPVQASWELSVTDKIKETVTPELVQLCAKPVVLREELQAAASRCEIAPDMLHRALLFLHGTGSVVYFPDKPGRLSEHVFMQPQWIVDAIKYVIRESEKTNMNDELRLLDDMVGLAGLGTELENFKQNGELDDKLLRAYLWGLPKHTAPHPRAGQPKFPTEVMGLLIELMQNFHLLVPIPGRKPKTYLVPAMLHTEGELAPCFTQPDWWLPAACSGASAMMRRVFAARFLPFGLASEVQVRVSLNLEAYAEHKAGGSVLRMYSQHDGGVVREVVVVSISREKSGEKIRMIGWAEIVETRVQPGGDGAKAVTTEWPLFLGVKREIEAAAACRLGVVMDEQVPLVDDRGGLLAIQSVSRLCSQNVMIEVRHGQQTVLKKRTELFPEPTLLQPPGYSNLRPTVHRPKILAFCSKEKQDFLNVHGEGQLLINMCERSSFAPPILYPQPKFKDFRRSLKSARLNNVTIVHFAGHGEDQQGIHFLCDDAGKKTELVDPKILSETVGAESTKEGGPIECMVLNACSTEAVGSLLRSDGVPHVICWQSTVDDEVAVEFSQAFYECLEGQYAAVAAEASAPTAGKTTEVCFRRAFEEGWRAAKLQVIKEAEAGGRGPEAVRRKRITQQVKPNEPVFWSCTGDINVSHLKKGAGASTVSAARAQGGDKPQEEDPGRVERESHSVDAALLRQRVDAVVLRVDQQQRASLSDCGEPQASRSSDEACRPAQVQAQGRLTRRLAQVIGVCRQEWAGMLWLASSVAWLVSVRKRKRLRQWWYAFLFSTTAAVFWRVFMSCAKHGAPRRIDTDDLGEEEYSGQRGIRGHGSDGDQQEGAV